MMRNLIIALLLFPLQLNAIEFVTVGDPENVPASNGKGIVEYEYEISKFEITNAEYCKFLNCVASTSDSFALFSPLMQNHFFGGIIRTGSKGNYTYKCKVGYENTPIVGLTWMSAVRYLNWLHYNASNIENNAPIDEYSKQTEGDDIYGAYDTRSVPKVRNVSALYWMPNENEWLKAAFFNGNSWDESLFIDGSNCYTDKGWSYPYPHIKAVGKGVLSSHYGTYDQQGNAAEWIENARESDNEWKLAKGGSLIRPSTFAMFSEVEGDFPTKSITTFGLRICRLSDEIKRKNADVGVFIPTHVNQIPISGIYDKCGNEYVLVGDPGNTGDVVNQFKGRVNYEFLILRTELSNASYCKFLNSVAAIDDPFGLYDENMAIGALGGIVREYNGISYIYHCKEGWDNRPVVYVNYYDIARYANWMHYGCPSGKCELGVTEGTASQGAYDTNDFENVRMRNKNPYESFGKRNKGARFWIPSDNEWYKAAYYNPTKTGTRKYHDYPTQTSDAPSSKSANYMVNNNFSIGEPFYLAPIDSFQNAPSYYGTLQQGGNVWEWIEDWQYGQVGSRGLRGGSWSYTYYGLNAINVDPGGLDNSGYVFGARLCMAPSESGWQPVRTPLIVRIYEYIVLMPKSYFMVALALLSIILVLSTTMCFAVIIRSLINRNR